MVLVENVPQAALSQYKDVMTSILLASLSCLSVCLCLSFDGERLPLALSLSRSVSVTYARTNAVDRLSNGHSVNQSGILSISLWEPPSSPCCISMRVHAYRCTCMLHTAIISSTMPLNSTCAVNISSTMPLNNTCAVQISSAMQPHYTSQSK